MALSNQEPRGTLDRFPEEFAIRKYIFDTWRKVCKQFGYQEYLAPLVENAEIYRAKSGEDVGGTELTLLTDRDGNVSELALRPEMTPSVTRMLTKIYKQSSKPIRYFSIANFYRNERPQRGRNREFRQLNIDLFGSESLQADIEILRLSMEIIRAFNPPAQARELHLNHRKLIDHILENELHIDGDLKKEVVRTMDKRNKMTPESFGQTLQTKGITDTKIITQIIQYMQSKTIADLKNIFPQIDQTQGYQELETIISQLTTLGYSQRLVFNPSVIRGFDYYDGMVFEVFDKHPDNNRAMFGGGRYNGLSEVFGTEKIPAVGCAPGDEALKLFLESRNLLEKVQYSPKTYYYIPILEESLLTDYQKLTKKYRQQKTATVLGLSTQKIGKAIEYADKNKFTHIVLLGTSEKYDNIYKIKNLSTGEESYQPLEA